MCTFLDPDLLYHIFHCPSGTVAAFALNFVSEPFAVRTGYFLFVFAMKYLALTATWNACLRLLIWTWRTVYLSGEFYCLFYPFKWFSQTDAQVDVDVLASFWSFELFIRPIVLVKCLKVLPILFKGSFSPFLWVSLIGVMSFTIFIKAWSLPFLIGIILINFISIFYDKVISLSIFSRRITLVISANLWCELYYLLTSGWYCFASW
jgi:hypothetical protein